MGESEHIPGVALHVFGGDVRLAVNGGFSRLAPGEQRHILALCRETLGLALGERVQGAEWVGCDCDPAPFRLRTQHGG